MSSAARAETLVALRLWRHLLLIVIVLLSKTKLCAKAGF